MTENIAKYKCPWCNSLVYDVEALNCPRCSGYLPLKTLHGSDFLAPQPPRFIPIQYRWRKLLVFLIPFFGSLIFLFGIFYWIIIPKFIIKKFELLPVILSGAMILAFGYVVLTMILNRYRLIRLLKYGIPAKAKLISVREENTQNPNQKSEPFKIFQYVFMTEEEQKILGEAVEPLPPVQWAEGDSITVVYFKDDPETSTIWPP